MNERKSAVIGTAMMCVMSGIVGAVVGFKVRLDQWPSDQFLNESIWRGAIPGVIAAIIAGLLILRAAPGKLWIVTIVGCILAFSCGWFYQAKTINDNIERMRRPEL